MKYEKFREIQNSMWAVTINSEFSLPGLIAVGTVLNSTEQRRGVPWNPWNHI